ncbi:murein biosynthesis integral membrane protein MurJ [Streptomyces sp. OZ13]|uniref:murein biosynthesis integral membrane protein MurJ n=1 Tax=Streptomyces sp. OZ13 TaxID=3452210 RepID=UPI003F8C8436
MTDEPGPAPGRRPPGGASLAPGRHAAPPADDAAGAARALAPERATRASIADGAADDRPSHEGPEQRPAVAVGGKPRGASARRGHGAATGAFPRAAAPARGRHARRGGRAGGAGRGTPPVLGRFLVRAAAVTAGLTAAGSVLGLVRDQTIAHFFGAGVESDAFLIAWTVPEMASTLLIEDAMALLLVPAFSHALARRTAGDRSADPVGELVSATFPRLFALLTCAAGLLLIGAPLVVRVLAPGFGDPALAVDCTRMTALTVLTFGVTGYFSAALRAHGSFLRPASVYVAYNAGIIATTLALHSVWGVRAAAAGVAVGGLLMVAVQLPAFARRVTLRPLVRRARSRAPLLGAAVLAPVVLFAVSRQSQVLVERFLAAPLPAGAISHLNYAQKVAQMPMVLSLMVCTVTFPVVAKAMAEGDRDRARRRVEQDLAMAGATVLLGTAMVVGYAPQIIEVLFQRGAFDARDTEATATVMRVYAAGLLGHCLVGALGRPFFSSGRPTWFPAAAMAAGLAVTVAAGAVTVGTFGVHGIAAANAAGISTTALLLLCGLGSRGVAIQVRSVGGRIGRLTVAAAAATAAGLLAAPLTGGPLRSLAAGCLLLPAVFLLTARALRAPEAVHLLGLARRRLLHDH